MSTGNSTSLIPAVGYLRKSTKGERKSDSGKRRQKQEKSIPQQKEEIMKLARGRFLIVKWFEDEGISGWKRGAKRPDFQRMITEVQGLGAQAILCDNIDRFSRATYDDVQEDTRELRKAGARWIVTASHGDYDLGHRNDIGEIIKFAAAVWSAHEYSKNLGRRIALARRDKAADGKRTGGPAPYGLADDSQGGLKPGDPEKAKVVIWLFGQFGNELLSLHGLASDLNARAVPGPTGGKWYVKTIAGILRNPAYRGDFSYNRNPEGQFFRLNAEGEAVEVAELDGTPSKVFVKERAYRPIVEPALFDKVQRRLATLKDCSRRKRMGYPLSGILKCDHCGLPMYGVKPQGYLPAIYRCASDGSHGAGARGYRQVREDRILPFVLEMLGEEIADLKGLLPTPPDSLTSPHTEWAEQRKRVQSERDRLAARIAKAEEAILDCEDKRTRQSLDKKVSDMRDELDRLDAELSTKPEDDRRSEEQLAALAAWWDDFLATAVRLPVRDDLQLQALGIDEDELTPKIMEEDEITPEMIEEAREELACSGIEVDPRKVNDALHQLGCEVRLRWATQEYVSRAGNRRRRHVLVKGRFRLGQRMGSISVQVLEPAAGRARRAPR
jgi:site-specific DNA recombinase